MDLKSTDDLSSKGKNLLDQLLSMHSEGIDLSVEKIFETNHPYDRGIVVNFE
jgi:hypothetical protein